MTLKSVNYLNDVIKTYSASTSENENLVVALCAAQAKITLGSSKQQIRHSKLFHDIESNCQCHSTVCAELWYQLMTTARYFEKALNLATQQGMALGIYGVMSQGLRGTFEQGILALYKYFIDFYQKHEDDLNVLNPSRPKRN